MKSIYSIRSGIALGALVLLSACGSGSSGTSTVGTIPGGIGNNPYDPNNPGSIPTGQCVPINGYQPIPFIGQGIYRDSANIIGGRLPFTGQTVGAMGIGGNTQIGYGTYNWGFQGAAYGRQGSDGTIIIQESNINGMNPQQGYPYSGYPYNTQGYNPNPYANNQQYGQYYYGQYPQQWGPSQINVQGTIMLSQLVVQDIMYHMGGSAPNLGQGYYPGYGNMGNGGNFWMNGGQQQQICASGIAMNVGHYNSTVYGGQVYLYLNGTQHGYILYF